MANSINAYQIKQFTIEPEFKLIYLNYQPTEDHIVLSHNPYNKPMLAITIGLKGQSYFRAAKHPEICFNAKQTTVTTFSAIRGERCYQKGETIEQLRLIIGESVLQRYLGSQKTTQLLTDNSLKSLAYQHTSAMSLSYAKMLAYQFYQKLDDPLKFHIYSLSLLSEQINDLLPQSIKVKNQLSLTEIEKLEQVRTVLLTEYQHHITENYLCIKIGLNKTKLKTGFAELYNATPYQMLLEIRMHKAHLLLEQGVQVAQTAWLVGYPYANNFSVAFIRYFGYSPKSVFK